MCLGAATSSRLRGGVIQNCVTRGMGKSQSEYGIVRCQGSWRCMLELCADMLKAHTTTHRLTPQSTKAKAKVHLSIYDVPAYMCVCM